MIYTLKPINTTNNWNKINRFSNTYVRIGAPLGIASGLPVTGLTKDDELFFEEELRMSQGTLSPMSDFWDTFHVQVGKEGLMLDTEENPEHLFWVKFLKANPIIANGAEELKIKSGAEFILSSPEEDAKVKNEGRKFKKEAYALFNNLTPSDMRGILILLGKPSEDVSDDIVEDQLGSIMEADFKKFINIAKDTDLKMKIFIYKCVNTGVIRKVGYSDNAELYYRDIFLGKDLKESIAFLNTKANIEVYTGIQKELSTALNMKS